MGGLSRGQSLVEVLVAVALGGVIILAAVAATHVSLRIASQDPTWQTGNFLAEQLLDNVAATAEGKWSDIKGATGASYLAATSAGRFEVRAGAETVINNNISYSRSFSVAPVYRNANGEIVDSGTKDPSTGRVTVDIQWHYQGDPTNIVLQRYITRTQNVVWQQTDWGGGPTCPGSDPAVTNIVHTRFCEGTAEIDFSSQSGSIKIKGY